MTVPAGTFSAIRIESPIYAGGTLIEWWSWEAGLVRLDVVNEAGVLRGRFVRSAGGFLGVSVGAGRWKGSAGAERP